MPKLSTCSEILYVLGIALCTTSTADEHVHWPACLNDPLIPPQQSSATALPATPPAPTFFPFEEEPAKPTRHKRDVNASTSLHEQDAYAQLLSVDVLRYLGLQLITFYTSDVTGVESGVSFSVLHCCVFSLILSLMAVYDNVTDDNRE